MKTEQQYFEEGKTLQQYMDEMSKLKAESFSVYENFQLPEDKEWLDEVKNSHIHLLIITEDWCGDAMMINPIVRKIAEAANIEVRVALRDADTALIDRHLTNGGRAIPIILILNQDGELIGKWGPRAPEVQKIVDEYRANLPHKDDPTFKERMNEMIATLQKRYTSEEQLWYYVYESMKQKLLQVIK